MNCDDCNRPLLHQEDDSYYCPRCDIHYTPIDEERLDDYEPNESEYEDE